MQEISQLKLTNAFLQYNLYNKLSYTRILIGSHLWSLEDKRIDDVIIKTFFNSLLYKTNRFQVAVRLFSNISQRTSKGGKNISDTLGCALYATFLFLPPFDVICDLLLNRRTATWNQLGIKIFSRDLYGWGQPQGTYVLLEVLSLDSWVHYFQSIHNSDIFEVRGVQIENIENRMVSPNSVNEITNFNLSCAVALYSLC